MNSSAISVSGLQKAYRVQMTANQVQQPAIHVQGLEKSYKRLHVLRGVDFDVARGIIFALLAC